MNQGWTETRISRAGAIVDPNSVTLSSGRQWAWDDVPDSFKGTDGNKVIPAFTVYSERADGLMVPRSLTKSITSVVVASNVATATKTAHGYSVGDVIFVSGSNLAYANGLKTIATVPDANTFTYEAVGANATATGTIVAARGARGLTATNATENSPTDSLSGYGTLTGGAFYENLLPDATGTPKLLPTQYKTELATNGAGFVFEQYGDSRAS